MAKQEMLNRTKDLTGKRFGRLKILSFAGYQKNKATWLCECDCGNKKVIIGKNITNGKSLSCGCIQRELLIKNFTKHGASSKKERLYVIWKNMKSRCFNSSNPSYDRYGGRGITVCEDWKNNYISFRDWAINNGYKDDLTIDRIDNNGNYEPTNCRWATIKEQSRNRNTNVFVEYNGKIFVVKDFAKIIGIDRHTLSKKINEGVSVEEIIKYAQNKHKNFYDGDEQ